MTAFETELLQRLDRIASDVAELRQPQAARDLLREIARSAGASAFSVSELLRHAELDAGLRAAVLAMVGDSDPARSVGQLLRRCSGREVGGVLTAKIGSDGAAAVWRTSVRPIKPALPVATAAPCVEDSPTTTEGECNV